MYLLNLRTLEAENGESNLLGMQIAGKNAEIKLKLDTMIPLAELSEVPKNCTPCRFFEVIAEQTREQGIKIQKKIAYLTELNKTRLKTEITALGHDFVGNSEKIFNLEKNLGKILDNELRDKLQDYKVFEVLNAEKASPHFLEICKKNNTRGGPIRYL